MRHLALASAALLVAVLLVFALRTSPERAVARGESVQADLGQSAPAEEVSATRAAGIADVQSAPDRAAVAAGTATVVVICLDEVEQAPLSGVEVRMTGEDETVLVKHTDATGRATLNVLPDQRWFLVAEWAEQSKNELLAPLRSGDERTVLVKFGPNTYYGRVRSGGAGHAIAAASVWPFSGDVGDEYAYDMEELKRKTSPYRTRADGMFELEAEGVAGAVVTAPGYAPRWFQCVPGHGNEGTPHELRMDLGAALEVRVLDRKEAPLHGANARLELLNAATLGGRSNAFLNPAALWQSQTRVEGVVYFDDLPSRVPLQLTISSEDVTSSKIVVINDQEVRRIDVVLGTQLRSIAGVVVDEDGEPVGRLTIVATPVPRAFPRSISEGGFAAQAVTEQDGSFELLMEAQDLVLLGPSPLQEDFVPLGLPVDLGRGPATDVVLRVARARQISGIVLDQQGLPVSGMITARDADFSTFKELEVDPSGVFSIEGLWPGQYVLTAAGEDGRPSPPQLVTAGSNSVELRVIGAEERGDLRVSVYDATSELPLAGVLTISVEDTRLLAVHGGPEFIVDALMPGTYGLAFTSQEERVGVGSATVLSGARAELSLAAVKGGTLVVRNEESMPRTVRVSVGGVLFVEYFLHASESARFLLPSGEASLVISQGPLSYESRTVTVSEGGDALVVLGQ